MKLKENFGTCGDLLICSWDKIFFSFVFSTVWRAPLPFGFSLCWLFCCCCCCLLSFLYSAYTLKRATVEIPHLITGTQVPIIKAYPKGRKNLSSSLTSKWVPLPLAKEVFCEKLWASHLCLKVSCSLCLACLFQVIKSNGMAGVSWKWWELPSPHRRWAQRVPNEDRAGMS